VQVNDFEVHDLRHMPVFVTGVFTRVRYKKKLQIAGLCAVPLQRRGWVRLILKCMNFEWSGWVIFTKI